MGTTLCAMLTVECFLEDPASRLEKPGAFLPTSGYVRPMSAIEIIELIKALPHADQAQVKAFVRELPDAETPLGQAVMDPEKARQISQRIFAENRELFTKLAQ